jgi:hypothetical protein
MAVVLGLGAAAVGISFLNTEEGEPAGPKEEEEEAVADIDDPEFGRLKWNSEFQYWQGARTALGNEYTIQITPCSAEDRRISDPARQSFRRVASNLSEVFEQATDSVLPDFREQWSREEAFSRDRLRQLLYLSTIVIEPDGYLEVEFSDQSEEEFLGGHSVVSRFHPDGTREVVLEG